MTRNELSAILELAPGALASRRHSLLKGAKCLLRCRNEHKNAFVNLLTFRYLAALLAIAFLFCQQLYEAARFSQDEGKAGAESATIRHRQRIYRSTSTFSVIIVD
jgi:hypothetical protein